MSLLGDEVVELLFGDDTITVGICSLDHFLEDIIVGEFSQILGNLAEILQGDEACFLGIEGDEDLMDLISGFVVGRTGCHHVEKFGEFDLSTAIGVEFSDHLIDGLGFGFNTEGVDGDFEF